MKCHWTLNESTSKTPSTLGRKIGPLIETECDAGPIKWSSGQKGCSNFEKRHFRYIYKNANDLGHTSDCQKWFCLKLVVAAIFYQIFIFSSNDRPLKPMKNVFYFIEKVLFILEIFNFCNFSLPFYTFQIQKGKWKWNNL